MGKHRHHRSNKEVELTRKPSPVNAAVQPSQAIEKIKHRHRRHSHNETSKEDEKSTRQLQSQSQNKLAEAPSDPTPQKIEEIDILKEEEGFKEEIEKNLDQEFLDNVTFDFMDPRETDYFSIKLLIDPYVYHDSLEGFSFEAARMVSEQPEVGCVVKTEEEEGKQKVVPGSEDDFCLGYCSALSIPYYLSDEKSPNAKMMECFVDFMTETFTTALKKGVAFKYNRKNFEFSNKNITIDDLASYFNVPKEQKHLGLLLTGRYVNLPAECTLNMFDTVIGDIEWTQSNDYIVTEEDKEIRMPPHAFSFTHFIGFSKATKIQNVNSEHVTNIFDIIDPETVDRPEHTELLNSAELIWTFNLDLKNNNNADENCLKVQDTGILYIVSMTNFKKTIKMLLN